MPTNIICKSVNELDLAAEKLLQTHADARVFAFYGGMGVGKTTFIKAICKKPNGDVGGVRFSLGRDTRKSDIDYTVKSLSEILQKLKKWYD